MKIILLISALLLAGCVSVPRDLPSPISELSVSPAVSQNFINLDNISRISKYRSGYGHDFSYAEDETCRSMKHYFDIKKAPEARKGGVDPRSVTYVAPVDGTITDIRQTKNEYGIVESQFSIRSNENKNYFFRFFHVAMESKFKNGARVHAGEIIGAIGHPQAHGEIAVEERRGRQTILHSWFDIIDTELSHEYADRGVHKENIIIKKEVRDANPLTCDFNTPDGRFVPKQGQGIKEFQEWQSGEENWKYLKKI